MKQLKLIINRFVETDSIDVPINVTTTFDATGVTQLRSTIAQIESAFKKSSSGSTTMSASMSNYFNTSSLEKYKSTMANLKDSLKGYKPTVTIGEQFGRNTSSMLEMKNIYGTVLDKFEQSVPTIEKIGDSMKQTFKADYVAELKEQVQDAYASWKYYNKEQDNVQSKSEKTGNVLKNLSKMMKTSLIVQIQALAHVLKRTFNFLTESFTAAGDYVESMNLYTMSVGQYADAGKKWAKEISDALYLDESEIYQYTGQFFNLTRGLGASAKAADLMSRNLTQLSYDMSSYLNIDVSVANNKLMSAMSGQTKAVTSVGVAVQSASLQELAYSLGIQKSVEEMTQAEKTYLRYIQIMRSTTQMQGDLGRTIITPTNAMRLLRTQMNLLARAIGQVVTPAIMNLLPVVIALTQLLTELAQTIAGMRGYKIEDYLAPADSVKELADNFVDLDDAAKGAGKSINRTLAPFDELNVVESKSKGRGGGGVDTGSVLSDLEKYLTGYDMLEFYTDSVKNKVESIKKAMKDLLPVVAAIGGAFAAWKIGKTIVDFFSAIYNNKGNIQKKVGMTLVIASVALSYAGSLDIKQGKFWEGIGKQVGASFGVGVGTFLMTKNLQLSLVATALQFTVNAIFDADNFWAAALNILGGSLVVGGTVLKYTKNLQLTFAVTVGYALVSTLATWLFGGEKEESLIDQFKESRDAAKDFNDEISKTYENIYKNRDASLELVGSHQKLYEELTNLVDANGKIKTGYEDRVNFILNQLKEAYGIEYKIVDGEIQQYDKLKQAIEEIISKKKLEILLEANKEAYIEAIKNERKSIDELNKSTKKLQEAESDMKVTEAELKKKKDELTAAESRYKNGLMSDASYRKLSNSVLELSMVYRGQKNAVEVLREENDKWKDTVQKNTKAIADYNDGLAASYSNDAEKINGAVDNMTGHLEGSLSEQLSFAKTSRDEMVAYYKKTNGEITEDQQKSADAQYETVKKSLISQSQTVSGLTPEIREAWRTLGYQDKQAFEEGVSGLPEEVRKELTDTPTIIEHDLKPRFEAIAADVGRVFGNTMSSNMKINKNTLQSTLADAIQNVKLPRWLKNTPMGKMAENLGFQFYAKGGFPDTGEMFVARESGPELVGKIGNRTAVANNDQITTAMTNAMTVALQGMNNKQPVQNTIYIGNKKVFDGMGDYIDSENDRYGTNYVRV